MSESEILEILRNNCIFDLYLTEKNFSKKIVDPFDNAASNLGYLSYEIRSGATKVVIVPNNETFVIKIPFTGEEDRYGDYEDFCFDLYGEQTWDHCKKESKIFSLAEENDISSFFAKEELIEEINGHPIYMQEKISKRVCDCNFDTIIWADFPCFNKFCQNMRYPRFCSKWQYDVYRNYGIKMFNKLMKFIDDYEIKDLHNENLGYLNGCPMLIDYSGYHSTSIGSY